MIDWNEIGRQIQPAIINFVTAIIGIAATVVTGFLSAYLAKKTGKESAEADLARLQHGKEVAAIAVKAAEQNPAIVGNNNMKTSALDTVSSIVPKLGDHLHDKLVEAAVKDMRTEETMLAPVEDDSVVLDMDNAG
jgi:hypothetical protein